MTGTEIFDFELRVRATIRDIPFEVVIACGHCSYVTMFWSLREAEKDFCQHLHAKHPK